MAPSHTYKSLDKTQYFIIRLKLIFGQRISKLRKVSKVWNLAHHERNHGPRTNMKQRMKVILTELLILICMENECVA